jgi:large subunit ribosomal protein L33
MRTIIQLVCDACGRFNYGTTKNKTRTPDKLEKKKFCRACRGHKLHKEKR